MKHAAIVLVALVLVAGAWLAWKGQRTRATSGAPTAESARNGATPETLSSAVPESTTPETISPPPREPVVAPAATVVGSALRGRCVDGETGMPLAGCEVTLHGRSPQSEENGENGSGSAWSDLPVQITKGDGVFAFALAPPARYVITLRAQCPGRLMRVATWWPLPAGVTDVGDVAMYGGCAVHGRVADTRGAAQSGVEIDVQPAEEHSSQGLQPIGGMSLRADGDGNFTFSAAPGRWRVFVEHRRVVAPELVTIAAGDRDLQVDITTVPFDEMPSIRGVLIDDAGAAVSRATVEGGASGTETERDGSFLLLRAKSETEDAIHLSFRSIDGAHEDFVTEQVYPWGTSDLRLVMKRKPGADLLVVDAQGGAPIEEYGVRCFPVGGSMWNARDWELRGQGHHAEGKTRLDGVARGADGLIVAPSDPAWDDTALVAFDSGALGAAPLRVALARKVDATVRVCSHSGAPIAGTQVELLRPWFETPIDLETIALAPAQLGRTNQMRRALLVASGKTGDDGRVALRGPPDTALAVRVLGPGHIPCVVAPVTITSGGETVIPVDSGATLIGAIAPQRLLDKLRQWAGGSRQPGLVLLRDGGSPRRFPTDDKPFPLAADGTFSWSGIPPGTWDAHFAFDSPIATTDGSTMHGSRRELLQRIVLHDGETNELHAHLETLYPGRLRGRVLLDGAVPVEAKVHVFAVEADGSEGGDQGTIRLDADGAFVVEFMAKGCRVDLICMRAGRYVQLPAAETAIVPADAEVEQTFTVSSAAARIRVLGSDGKPVPGVTLDATTPGDTWGTTAPPTDAEGWTAIDPVPAGDLVLNTRPKHLVDPEAWDAFWKAHERNATSRALTRVEVGRVAARAGATNELEVTLPASSGY